MLKLDHKKYKRPLIITSHPDDLEGFVGGLSYLLAHNVVSVVFAGGDLGIWDSTYEHLPLEEYIEIRKTESNAGGKVLGLSEILYMGYHDRDIPVNETTIQQVLDQLERYQPDVVISFEFFRFSTPYPHPDHMAVAQIVRSAVARYGLDHTLDYYVCSTLFPNRFVDVSAVRRIKLDALACHATQKGLNAIIFPFFERLLSKLWGIYIGADYAEAYRKVYIPKLQKRLGIETKVDVSFGESEAEGV